MSSVKNRQIIDSHCHLQFTQYDFDRDEVIRRAIEKGIKMVCVGTNTENSWQAVKLAEQYEGLHASVGIHPTESGDVPVELARHPKVVAIGEIGLDYYHTGDRAQQKELFEHQLALAREVHKPIIVHCRDAHDDTIAILKNANLCGVIHSFNGTAKRAQEYIELGYFIGLNAIVTFSDQYTEMVRSLPLDRILLETDAPYLAPAPYRGKHNEPSYVEIIGIKIAEIRGIEPDELFYATSNNVSIVMFI